MICDAEITGIKKVRKKATQNCLSLYLRNFNAFMISRYRPISFTLR